MVNSDHSLVLIMETDWDEVVSPNGLLDIYIPGETEMKAARARLRALQEEDNTKKGSQKWV